MLHKNNKRPVPMLSFDKIERNINQKIYTLFYDKV